MRVGFAGTPAFAARALASIETEGFTIPLVLTQPDRPFGRGLSIAPPPVKRYAAEHELPLVQPASLKLDAVQAALRICRGWGYQARFGNFQFERMKWQV